MDLTLELLGYKGISGPLHWYYIVCHPFKTIISLDYVSLSIEFSYFIVHIYPICLYHMSLHPWNFLIYIFYVGSLLLAIYLRFSCKGDATPEIHISPSSTYLDYSLYSKYQTCHITEITHSMQ